MSAYFILLVYGQQSDVYVVDGSVK